MILPVSAIVNRTHLTPTEAKVPGSTSAAGGGTDLLRSVVAALSTRSECRRGELHHNPTAILRVRQRVAAPLSPFESCAITAARSLTVYSLLGTRSQAQLRLLHPCIGEDELHAAMVLDPSVPAVRASGADVLPDRGGSNTTSEARPVVRWSTASLRWRGP